MLYYEKGDTNTALTDGEVSKAVLEAIDSTGLHNKMLLVPPDITRIHSGAGRITEMIWGKYGDRVKEILPALGTHRPMTGDEINRMFGKVPESLFREHNWRDDVVTLGEVPGSYIESVSEGKLSYSWPVQVNKLLLEYANSLIISVGQVVPHEVIGMANYNKNIFIGCGGPEGINKSHYLGAVYGMERIMGQAINPVREVLNFGESAFADDMNILYILTVVGTDNDGKLVTRGLYIGTDPECFLKASELSTRVNFTTLEKPLKKAIVWLDPDEFRSTWLGNKAIYRTRMAMADGGELIIVAPGVEEFGEDTEIDRLIRKYGYRTSEEILRLVERNEDLQSNLGVAAHLIHGSPENRFKVTYCSGKLPEPEIRKVGFEFADYKAIAEEYNINALKEGYNELPSGEELFYISNPALGLWKTE